jgi:hypothetical protein
MASNPSRTHPRTHRTHRVAQAAHTVEESCATVPEGSPHELDPDAALLQQHIRRVRSKSSMQKLDADQEAIVKDGINRELEKLALTLSVEPASITGSRQLAGSSIRQYASLFRGLELFLKRIGDFSSLLILNPNAPIRFCPSMSADSLLSYIDFKVLKCGEPLVVSRDFASDHSRIGPVFDYFTQRPMLASGSWSDPGCVNQLLSAISNLHLARYQNGPYTEPCADCITEYEAGNRSGCRFHVPNPCLFRKGSPRDFCHVKNRYTKATGTDLPDYQAQGNSPLLPHEIIDIRNFLLSRNSVNSLRMYVMLLFHTVLFLRAKSGVNFQFSDFLYGLVSVNRENDEVKSIGVKIKGKSDDSYKPMMIWRNDGVPELCLVRHLLLWIHISGNESGYLFCGTNGNPVQYGAFNAA